MSLQANEECQHPSEALCTCKYVGQRTAPGPSDATPCSASPSDLLPPREIIEAAATVSMWMEKMGYKNWQLGGICDRRFAIFGGRVRDASEKWEDPISLPNDTIHP